MHFEFDSGQRPWLGTARDAMAEECPPASIRNAVDHGADPAAHETVSQLGTLAKEFPSPVLTGAAVIGDAVHCW